MKKLTITKSSESGANKVARASYKAQTGILSNPLLSCSTGRRRRQPS